MYTSVRDLKTHLSAYLQRVQQGEELVVTSHNHPIAKLVPIMEEVVFADEAKKQFFVDLEQLHKSLSQSSEKESMSDFIIRQRRDGERY